MKVVAAERTVRPEQAGLARQSPQEGIARAGTRDRSWRQSRHLEGRTDPGSFRYLGVWGRQDTSEGFVDERRRSEVELSRTAPTPSYVRILRTSKRMQVPLETVFCQTTIGPASPAPILPGMLPLNLEPANRDQPGPILIMQRDKIGAPGSFLMMAGCRTRESLCIAAAAYCGDVHTQLAAVGGTLHHVIGVARFDSLSESTGGAHVAG